MTLDKFGGAIINTEKKYRFAKVSMALLSLLILNSCGSNFKFTDPSTWRVPETTKTYDDYMSSAYDAVTKGDSEQALAMYRKAIETAQSEYGPKDLRIATSTSYLASYCASLGLTVEAEANYRKALQLDETVLGPDDPETVRVKKSLAELLIKLYRLDEANALLHISKVVPPPKKSNTAKAIRP